MNIHAEIHLRKTEYAEARAINMTILAVGACDAASARVFVQREEYDKAKEL